MTNECGMELIILGDINIDYKDGCTNSKWSNMILDQSLTQLIDKLTRVTSTTSSIIDHVYVSHPEHIIETNVPIFAISDHYPVCITRKINQRDYPNLTHKTIQYRCFKTIKEDMFLADLQHINISQINLINDIQAATYMWYTLFMRIINKHAPLKTKRIKYSKQPDWLTDEIKEAQKKRTIFIKQVIG
jgi:hypothetical protein